MKFNIGDTVEVIYYPGVELTIVHRFRDQLNRNVYELSNATHRVEDQLRLLKAYRPEDKDSNLTPILIGIIIFVFILK